jgi:outer membrane protein TolC
VVKDEAEPMTRWTRSVRWLAPTLALASATLAASTARGENLQEAWGISLGVNQKLQAQQQTTIASGFEVKAANSARYFSVRSYNLETFLAQSPKTRPSFAGPTGGLPPLPPVFILGSKQTFFPVSLTTASIPLYTGGKLLKTVDSARHQLNAQKTQEQGTAIDLKLTVAEAYVGVLRAKRNLDTARSNVEQLTSFARDVKNRLEQGLAIRSDDLAAQVSLANAQLGEIQARTSLEAAWATYNRYLCRPLDQYAELEEISELPVDNEFWVQMAARVVANRGEFAGKNDAEVRDLTARAFQLRPELAGLVEQARSFGAQADATKANLRPQVLLTGGFIFLGAENFIPQGNGEVSLIVDWTFTDSGKSRRQAQSLKAQERATSKRRADLAADVALQVRTRWLDLQQARQKVPVARFAVIQAEENVKVITDRYRQQLATYTEVLDAETRRITSLNNFYNAVYDENLATFRLQRAVGDI